MFFYAVLAVLVVCAASPPGPRHPPSFGQVWPKPTYEEPLIGHSYIDPSKISVKFHETNICPYVKKLIDKAVKRWIDYTNVLAALVEKYGNTTDDIDDGETITELRIKLEGGDDIPCERYPYYGMNETYTLFVSPARYIMTSASTVWGFIRSLETLNHLCFITAKFRTGVRNMLIKDRPNYPHRGLLLDTSRHYIPVADILTTIDAMAMNKMNVLHWHVIDDESFPFQSKTYPELSEKGAYFRSLIYNRTNLEKIRDFATERAIRVVMEIDIPGHSASWGASHPEIITTNCTPKAYSSPMNPLKNETYDLLKGFLKEIQDVFPDTQIHLGGDEVNKHCWEENPEIQKYMKDHNMNIADLMTMFYNKVRSHLNATTTVIFWEDVFTSNVRLPVNNTFLQAWYGDGTEIIPILQAGFKAIQSNYYYLDELGSGFSHLYEQEPRLAIKNKLKNDTLLQNLVGGEACMWGEMVDHSNVINRVWPRASAVAEVLWSNTQGQAPDEETLKRIEEHTCRMLRRGVAAEPPTGPGFCVTS